MKIVLTIIEAETNLLNLKQKPKWWKAVAKILNFKQ